MRKNRKTVALYGAAEMHDGHNDKEKAMLQKLPQCLLKYGQNCKWKHSEK